MRTKVAIVGTSGKLGQLVTRLVDAEPEFEVYAAIGSRDKLSDSAGADLIVDVTVPSVTQSVVQFAIQNGISVLVGTSGWSGDRIAALKPTLADKPEVGVVIVPNFSLGSVLASSFSAMAARFFGSIEIVETHAATKIDSPSGTAVRTAELIGAARANVGPVTAPYSDQSARGQQIAGIPVHSLRLAGVTAKQDTIFGGTGEVLTISHETLAPSAYQAGILVALKAARSARGITIGLENLIDLRLAEFGV